MGVTSFTRSAIGILLCFTLSSCDSTSGKGRESAMQFAYSWSQTIKVMGLSGLARFREIKRQQESIEAVRTVLRAEGSEKLKKAADELEQLILYVSRSLTDNLEANYALVERDAEAARVPITFSDPARNSRLGLDASGGDESAEKALSALHKVIAEFTRLAGVDKELASRLKAGGKPGLGSDSTSGGWREVREELLNAYIQRNAVRLKQRGTIEKLATGSGAPLGFEGSKWHMSLAEVRAERPKAKVEDDGHLRERTEWFGRPVTVTYVFGTFGLLEVIVTFTSDGSLASYEKTRAALEAAHGTMPAAAKNEEFALVSKYKNGLFSIVHGLRPSGVEQVIFERTIF
jgi:hypothetical protein